jgi:hypothetical protein
MSKIIAINHLDKENWEVNFENLQQHYVDLFIGFDDNTSVVQFKDLKIKYELKQNKIIKQSNIYPPSGVKYICTDQTFLVVERLNLEKETEYELYLWAENNNKSFETTIKFTTPSTN